MTREEKVQVELARCKRDFLYFCLKYLWIIDKRGKRIEEVNARDLGEIAEELRERL